MNANQDTRGFVVHLVTRDGAHRGWWRCQPPGIVTLKEATRFWRTTDALAVIPQYRPKDVLRGEVWTHGLALAQGECGVALPPLECVP